MIVGLPQERKPGEARVALTPAAVREIVSQSGTVWLERGAGSGSGFEDEEYLAAGAILKSREQIFGEAELIVKVKEPQPEEFALFETGRMLFTFLHLAANQAVLDFLLEKRITALAYESLREGTELPLLAPMSEVAGRMAPIMGAYYLQSHHGGRGLLSSGAMGTPPARALILGAGVVGSNAARTAFGMGMDVTVLSLTDAKLRRIDELYNGHVKTLASNRDTLVRQLASADLVIGAVLVPNVRTPHLVSRADLALLQPGTVLVDVSVDQGGCFESSRPTTHADPIFVEDGFVHYCVANMPGAFPRTATQALCNQTLPYILRLLSLGPDWRRDSALESAVNTFEGDVVLPELMTEAS